MTKRILSVLVMACCAGLQAEMLYKPDANTLWIENGKNIQKSPKNSSKGWNSSELSITPLPDGKGFSIDATDPKKHGSGRYVNTSPEYPWFVYELKAITQYKGYRSYAVPCFGGICVFGQVSNPQKGIFATNVFEKKKPTKNEVRFLSYYQYGLKLDFGYFKMVKKPDYYITANSEAFKTRKEFGSGDKIKFTVNLKEPAEDVTLRFFDSYMVIPMQLNQQQVLQLKPENEEAKVWSAEVTIKTFAKKSGKINGKIMMKAIVLGGAINVPVWNYIDYPYKTEEKK
jgi:hypothetical protein